MSEPLIRYRVNSYAHNLEPDADGGLVRYSDVVSKLNELEQLRKDVLALEEKRVNLNREIGERDATIEHLQTRLNDTCDQFAETLKMRELEIEALQKENDRLSVRLNSPEIHDFADAIVREAAHQRERWGSEHDSGKSTSDWLWLVAHLATKATQAERYGDREKYLHHIITAAAACCNWHAHASSKDSGSDDKTSLVVRIRRYHENGLVARIRRYHESYKKTGLIGVYDHVLLKDLVVAADEIELAQSTVEAAIRFRVEVNREPGDVADVCEAQDDLFAAVGEYIRCRRTTTEDEPAGHSSDE